MNNLTSYLPVILRYAIVAAMSALAARGVISGDRTAIINQNVDVIVGALVSLATVAYALVKQPSDKAMTAAKAIDKELSKDATVVIQTPGPAPNIIVPPK